MSFSANDPHNGFGYPHCRECGSWVDPQKAFPYFCSDSCQLLFAVRFARMGYSVCLACEEPTLKPDDELCGECKEKTEELFDTEAAEANLPGVASSPAADDVGEGRR